MRQARSGRRDTGRRPWARFLTDAPEGQQAIDAAYADVREAFRYFLSSVDPPQRRFVLAGHSQGSLHLKPPDCEDVRGSPVADRLAAAYVIGCRSRFSMICPQWDFLACAAPDQGGLPSCHGQALPSLPIRRWCSMPMPPSPRSMGSRRAPAPMLCSNPLTGEYGGAGQMRAPISARWCPRTSMEKGELLPRSCPGALRQPRLAADRPTPPKWAATSCRGTTTTSYDLPLFWANTKADVIRRVEAWTKQAAN